MPSGTPKKYEEESKLQRQEDEKQINELLRKKDWLPWQETWERLRDTSIEYAGAEEKGAPAEELAAILRKYRTARMLCGQIGSKYSGKPEEAKKALKEILKIMEEENLPAKWAITRRENREKKKAGYKFNNRTRTWYKPKEE